MKRQRNTAGTHLHTVSPHSTSFAALSGAVATIFDRSNETVKTAQDIAVNAGFFVLACYAIHQYGHKLAV